jgi:hypothetical protein
MNSQGNTMKWPPRSEDLTPTDYHVRGHEKHDV